MVVKVHCIYQCFLIENIFFKAILSLLVFQFRDPVWLDYNFTEVCKHNDTP